MKSTISIVLSLIYLVASLGLEVNLHYCGGELATVGIYQSSGTCCCGDEEMEHNCCENDSHFFKLKEKHSPSQNISPDFFTLFPNSNLLVSNIIEQKPYEEPVFTSYPEAPPLKKPPLRVLNCSFTFYG